MKLHSSELHTASDVSDEQVLANQEELPEFERGLFEVDARDPDEVLPYTDEPFMEHVKAIATFDTVRAVPPDPTRRTVGKRGVNVQWQAGGASDHQRAAQPAGDCTSHCGVSKGALAAGRRQVAALWAGPAVRSRCCAKHSRSRRRRGC